MESIELRKFLLIVLTSLGAFIFLFNLGGRDLWEPDETRYAVIAREMEETGNWFLPHLNREIYAEKPPLFFWLVNLSTFFTGENTELTNRLPSALAGVITVLLTFLFGERLFNARVGFLSALVLATCFFFSQISRWLALDSLFTLLFLLTLYCFYRGYEKEEGRRKYFLLGGLFMGLGVLTKGPIAYLPIPIFLIFILLQKDVRKYWNRDLFLGFLLSLIVVLIWLIPACWEGGEDYTKRILFGQTIGRLAGEGKHFHPKSLFFYFIRFPLEFFPWIVFLPTAFIFGLRKGRDKRKEFLFISVWFVFTFLFFTFSIGKKDNYILPLYPAAALMVGISWDSVLQSQEREKGFILCLVILASLPMIAIGVFLLKIPQRLYPSVMPFHFLLPSILIWFLIGLGLALLFFLKKMKWVSFISLVTTFIIFQLYISWVIPKKNYPQRSMKAFSENVLKRMKTGDDLISCYFQPDGLLYYTKKPFIEVVRNKDRFAQVMYSSQRVFIVIQKVDLYQIEKDLNFEVSSLHETRVGHWDLVLISNKDIQQESKKE